MRVSNPTRSGCKGESIQITLVYVIELPNLSTCLFFYWMLYQLQAFSFNLVTTHTQLESMSTDFFLLESLSLKLCMHDQKLSGRKRSLNWAFWEHFLFGRASLLFCSFVTNLVVSRFNAIYIIVEYYLQSREIIYCINTFYFIV